MSYIHPIDQREISDHAAAVLFHINTLISEGSSFADAKKTAINGYNFNLIRPDLRGYLKDVCYDFSLADTERWAWRGNRETMWDDIRKGYWDNRFTRWLYIELGVIL